MVLFVLRVVGGVVVGVLVLVWSCYCGVCCSCVCIRLFLFLWRRGACDKGTRTTRGV